MKLGKKVAIIAIATSSLILSSSPAFAGQINGSGATFAQPLIDVCKVEFTKDTGHTVNYTAGGSGKGRTDFASNLVDFAASDSVYTSGFPAHLEYAAVYAAGIAIGYNLPTVKTPIYLSPAVIAQIFSGEIQNWNDVRIRTVNDGEVKVPVFATKKVTVKVGGKNTTQTVPVLDKAGKPKILKYNTVEANAKLPNLPITVYYRSDSSGTSEQFGKFLQGANAGENAALWPKTASGTFANSTPVSLSNFFNFQGANGSALVGAGVKSKIGAIGYAESAWFTSNNLGTALVQNWAKEFVPPTAAATSAFLGGGTIEANGSVTTPYQKAIPGAYPIGTASYGLVYPEAAKKDPEKQKIVAEWHTYLLEQCPKKFPEKGYIQITGALYDKAKAQIAKIK
ncbi:phosphate transport system substrate-binding protein [Candidatus Nanopelagicus hibericus]|uniref:Phosphate-binding protein n=1 Tax=Candidatus Nanopelagicus hibericus TaxID=1884915 RepID=A0A249K9Y1_9ACTN|nr:substrate-binding domain-containing protein [Candidatus Nanopelagicus hibericus]ASY13598.1 phosphate transport system substrate-binding protein [Candidatus Nanopelagicus hibericus]